MSQPWPYPGARWGKFDFHTVKHVYFDAETKGSMSSMVLNEIEETKIHCTRKFFDEINKKYRA